MAGKAKVAIIVRCTARERALIKARAKRDRRSLSSYILHTVTEHINEPWQRAEVEAKVEK